MAGRFPVLALGRPHSMFAARSLLGHSVRCVSVWSSQFMSIAVLGLSSQAFAQSSSVGNGAGLIGRPNFEAIADGMLGSGMAS